MYEIDCPGRHSSAAAVNSEPVQTHSASFLCEQSPILSPQPTLLSSISHFVYVHSPFINPDLGGSFTIYVLCSASTPTNSAVTTDMMTMHQDAVVEPCGA